MKTHPSRSVVAVIAFMIYGSAGFLSAATVNVGAVANSTNTGYYLTADGSINLAGKIRVGIFDISQSQISTMVSGWGNDYPTFSNYNDLASHFTELGIGGTSGTMVNGWSFNTNGAVAGTTTGVDTTILPTGSQLYVWSFNMTNFASSDFNSSTQWGLYTGGTNWISPASGPKSLNLAQVDSLGVLIGTDLSPTSNSVQMVAALPEASPLVLVSTALAATFLCFVLKRNSRRAG